MAALSWRQRVARWFYPLIMRFSKAGANGRVLEKTTASPPPRPFYQLGSQRATGQDYPFADLRGKAVLLVNTASNCGYTNQYAELQQLQEQYADRLVVLGFPANDFAEQEKGDDHAIQQFCQLNFGVSFPLMKKSVVVKQPQQHPVYRWLTDPALNGWNEQPPVWNFAKYLVSPDGRLLGYYGPAISPLDPALTHHL